MSKSENNSAPSKTANRWQSSRFKRLLHSVAFAKIYLVAALGILMSTTIYWSFLGAQVHRTNADQVVNAYLFENLSTFHGALVPSAHSFLIKWPLFYLIKLFGFSTNSFTFTTIAIAVATISLLVVFIYRIERRPLVLGTLCLALASVLLLVPAQPYAGGILPVNMAMITTRNLEYVMYIAALCLFVWSNKPLSWRSAVALIIMALLIASDKLFLTFTVGGALLAILAYGVTRGWNLVIVSIRWLVGGLAATAGAVSILALLGATKVTHIVSQSGLSPYSLVHSGHELLLGNIYAFLSLLTNFGANPAPDTRLLRNIPHQALSQILTPTGVALLINALVLVFGIYIVLRHLSKSLAFNQNIAVKLDRPSRLSLMLIWSSLAAAEAFAVTKHYYPVDARYLTIAMFALFVSAAAYLRQRDVKPEMLTLSGFAISVGILLALPHVAGAAKNDKAALSYLDDRNSTIAQVLGHHKVDVLVGDYWRVIPTKDLSKSTVNVLPLADCSNPRDTLSSKSWETDLKSHSFAYLLTLDGSLTNFAHCSIDDVVKVYGRPNASTIIAGTPLQPKEILMFYDLGANKSAPKDNNEGPPATVVPIQLDELPYNSCSVPTLMNLVAHEDDDMLFMNPDLIHEIKAGHCIRTVYMTAGDSGHDKFYWLGREHGSEAAYSKMTGSSDIWVERIVKLSDHSFITVANPRGNTKVSLVFMHLPDGNLGGQGFSASHFENLERLENGKVNQIHSVDNQSYYTIDELINGLTALMYTYRPTDIHTQSNLSSQHFPDHSDHAAVGRYTRKAYEQYEKQQFEGRIIIPITFYLGYPVHDRPENVFGQDLTDKEEAFLTYARFDGAVCRSVEDCRRNSAYNAYLTRQYTNPY